MGPFRIPQAAQAIMFPNRVDVVRRTSSFADAEGGRTDVDVTVASGLPCSVQPGAPRAMGPEGVMLAEGQIPVYFPADPRLRTHDSLLWVDSPTSRRLEVTESDDQGGVGMVWMAICTEVRGGEL